MKKSYTIKEAMEIFWLFGFPLALLSIGMQFFCVFYKIYDTNLTLYAILLIVPTFILYIVSLWFAKRGRYKLEIDFEKRSIKFY